MTPIFLDFDPWLRHPHNRGKVPADATLICTYRVPILIDELQQSLWLKRFQGLWHCFASDDFGQSGRIAIMDGFADNPIHVAGCAFDELVRARGDIHWPTEILREGLIDRRQFERVLEHILARRKMRIAKALSLADAHIVRKARELGLMPEPSGSSDTAWQSRCPGGNHGLMISAALNEFGCGYCKVKGGVAELEQFVLRRRGAKPTTRVEG